MNEDYRDILSALVAEQARFLVVGAHALAVHGYPRATVDIDIWIEPSDENAAHPRGDRPAACRPTRRYVCPLAI